LSSSCCASSQATFVEVKLRGDGGNVSQETIEMERHRLGLDKPLIYQFKDWMVGLVTLDLASRCGPTGRSPRDRDPPRIVDAGRHHGEHHRGAAGDPLGTTAALMRGTWVDYTVRIITIGGLSIPSFWSAC